MGTSKETVFFKKIPLSDATAMGWYTAMMKDNHETRAIFDLRWTNDHCLDIRVPFKLPSIQELVARLVEIGDCATKKFRNLHADVRNCYYQIPISHDLGRACCIRLDHEVLSPKVLPMGYRHACGRAQALVWSIILLSRENDQRPNIEDNVNTLAEAPAFVSLPNGGFITVQIDSILIMSTAADLMW